MYSLQSCLQGHPLPFFGSSQSYKKIAGGSKYRWSSNISGPLAQTLGKFTLKYKNHGEIYPSNTCHDDSRTYSCCHGQSKNNPKTLTVTSRMPIAGVICVDVRTRFVGGIRNAKSIGILSLRIDPPPRAIRAAPCPPTTQKSQYYSNCHACGVVPEDESDNTWSSTTSFFPHSKRRSNHTNRPQLGSVLRSTVEHYRNYVKY